MGISHFPHGISSFGNVINGGLGIGNVYYVCSTTDTTVYADLELKYGRESYDNDGSSILHSSLQSALDATVECRNDYVVVQPKHADIDITAALTMSKKAVHLICPAGMGYDMGANNALRIEQTTDDLAVIAVSDAAVEIAGFWFKPDPSSSGAIITLAATSYAPNIHHNYFTLKMDVANGAGIMGSGDGGAWGQIVRNKFECQISAQTYGSIVYLAASATGGEVSYNQFSIGNDSTATICIANNAYLGNTNFNIFSTCGGSGVATYGGQIGHAISIHTSGNAIGNLGAVGDGEMVTGGTANHSYCENYDGNSGGSLDPGS